MELEIVISEDAANSSSDVSKTTCFVPRVHKQKDLQFCVLFWDLVGRQDTNIDTFSKFFFKYDYVFAGFGVQPLGALHVEHRKSVRWNPAFRHLACRTSKERLKPGLQRIVALSNSYPWKPTHRPCFECRRADAHRFMSAWIAGNPQFRLAADCSIDQLDRHLHADRRRLADEHKLTAADLSELPSGVIVAEETDGSFYLLKDQRLHRWTETGYQPAEQAQPSQRWRVVTPSTTVNAIRSGCSPTIHPSIDRVSELPLSSTTDAVV